MIVNIGLLLRMNPGFARAIANGEKWAFDYAAKLQRLNDGDPYAFERNFDGVTRRNWCGNCGEPEGCIVCTLPPPRTRRDVVRPFK